MKTVVLLALVNCTSVPPAHRSTATAMPMVCKAKTAFGADLTLSLGDHTARVTVISSDGKAEIDKTIPVENTWDGHLTGLATGPGLSVKFESAYGCFRNVRITTNTRGNPGLIDELAVDTCTGGSTPDDVCLRATSSDRDRLVDRLRAISPTTTVDMLEATLGKPARDIGSGIHIFVYPLDGGEIRVGTADGISVDYIRLVEPNHERVLYER